MDIATILTAFLLGFAASRIGLPPLVGYLAAGFVLHGLDYESTAAIDLVADWGIFLLLFGIGLKLNLKTLLRPEVWAGASTHLVATTAAIGALLLGLGAAGLPLAGGLSAGDALLLGFAFSFSSTVFAVKALEDRNETSSLAGTLAIGILVIQDIFAVAFLASSTGDLPSPWAVPVVILVIAARPLYGWLLKTSGHGELLVLLGFFLAIGVGAGSFEQVGLKPDLGALVLGLVVAGYPRAAELSDKLLGFKDILLIGFFVSIGLGGTPSGAAAVVAVIVLLLLPLKSAGWLALLPRFRLRSRTAWHTSVTLATYSEFGLIVIAAAVDENLVDEQWTAAVAIVVAVSFIVAAPVNRARYGLYRRFARVLDGLERTPVHPDDALIEPTDARILVFGMGRIGSGAYDELVVRRGDVVLGIDRRTTTVDRHTRAGRAVTRGDALDVEFWERVRLHPEMDLVVLAMNDHAANLEAVRRVRSFLPGVKVAATARYPDEVAELTAAGVDVARNLYGEAGQGLADDACDLLP